MKSKGIRRKLQFAGNSSYVLTLPKEWIKSKGLDNQRDRSEVLIEEIQGNLRISPGDAKEEKKDTLYQINIGEKSPEEIVRLILAGYLASKNQITIQSSDQDTSIPPEIIIKVNQVVSALWGAEIVEEANYKIVIADALDPSSMKVEDLINRSWFTARNMLDHALAGVFEADEESVQRVENFENTLDRLYYLALRQLYKASSNSLFANEIGINPSEIINYHLLLKNIERLGDHSYKIIQNVGKEFENTEELKEVAKLAQEACSEAIEAFLDSTKSPDDPTPPEQNEYEQNLITRVQIAINKKSEILRLADQIELVESEFSLSRSLLRITDYASDIGELVLNRIVSDNTLK